MALIAAFIVSLNLYNYLSKRVEVCRFPDYYQKLASQCLQKGSYSCCISSVKNMRQGNYRIEPESGCPEGFNRNMLKCIDTFIWCEPTKQ